MGMTTWSEDRLTRVARAGGLERRRNGMWSRVGAKDALHLERATPGWLTMRHAVEIAPGKEPLAIHSDWAGPIKLVEDGRRVEQRIDLFLGTPWSAEDDPRLDADAADVLEGLTSRLLERFSDLGGATHFGGWQPPSAEVLSAWLQAAGCETAVDKEENVRITLKRRGFDGQVRVERGDGRLRFHLPLGRWKELSELSATAMKLVCRQVNARSRLVRIAWLASASEQRCDAQVDLSGLPLEPIMHPQVDMIWREMTRLAVGGLELALRQLGLELGVLADSAHHDLAAACGFAFE